MKRMAKLPRFNKALLSDWFSAALQTSRKAQRYEWPLFEIDMPFIWRC
jgi:hypothetical protein